MPNPEPTTFIARLPVAEAEARRIADALAESLDPLHAVCAAFEASSGDWQVEVHFVAPVTAATVRALITSIASADRAKVLRIAPTPMQDWIASSLAGLPPVRAGRFVVHGSHDRDRVPVNRIGIEIEAALAFGTGHHGTTRGCLLAIDALARRKKNRRVLRVLDVGTGSGVLAIAAAKLSRNRVLATDIDRRAVLTARANARTNHVGALIEAVHTAGVPRLASRAKYDLVLANILLQPLQRMAAGLARKLAPAGHVILSGLLPSHANAVTVAYRAQGLVLKRRLALEGWITLVMKRPAAARR